MVLPTHRIYRQIDQPLHLMGLEPEDVFILAGAFIACSRLARIIAVAMGILRLQFLLALLGSAVLFYLWRRFRVGRPPLLLPAPPRVRERTRYLSGHAGRRGHPLHVVRSPA